MNKANKSTSSVEKSKSTDKKISKTVAEKTTTKKSAPTKARKTAAAKAPAKRTPRKPKEMSVSEICSKLEKMLDTSKAAVVTDTVAVDVEVWGWSDEASRHFYIEVKGGEVTVSPHEYRDSSFNAYISYENIVKFISGKYTLKDAVSSLGLNANGNIPAALVIASLFK